MIALKTGDVLDLSDEDYKYGTGRLILRVTRISGRTTAADGEWVDLEGSELRSDGTPLGPLLRHALVRVAALRRFREPSERLN
jgi:hypothetical protein